MKVAIDSGPLTSGHSVRGVGVYTREIIEALGKATRGREDIKILPLDFSTLSSKIKAQNFDLVHYPYFHPYFFTLPLSKTTKIVVTIHDLIPLVYPKHYPPGLKGRVRFFIQRLLVKKVDGIIAPSETSKKDIVRFLGIPQERIKVIYEAPRKIFKKLEIGRASPKAMLAARNWKLEIKKRYALPERFVLYVGDVNYNKNILGLAEACKLADISLVIVGKQAADVGAELLHPENRSFAELLRKYGKDRKVIRLGFVPDEDLVGIFNLASVYCQPSFYEGFGLPVLEAMTSSTPVVAAKTQALVEIAEDSAIFSDPRDPRDIAKKITLVLKDPTSLKLRGARRAKNFSWAKAAKETVQFYQQISSK